MITSKFVGNATGTVISKDGKILTNRHVIRKYNFSTQDYDYFSNIYIRFYNKETFEKVSLLCYSNECDLALLQTPSPIKNFFNLGNGMLKMGQQAHTIGNGNGFGLAFSSGFIATPIKNVKYENTYIDAIQLDLVINEGNSGGALFDNAGKLIGVTTFRLRDSQNNIIYGSCFALPTKTIKSFLDNIKV